MAHKGSYKSTPKAQKARVGMKIEHLMVEGKTHKQAVGAAMGMARAGRITKTGGYRRKGR